MEIFLNHPKIALIEAVALVEARNETKDESRKYHY